MKKNMVEAGMNRPPLGAELEHSPEGLRQFARYLLGVADAIEARAADAGQAGEPAQLRLPMNDAELANAAVTLYRARRRRARHFDERLFGEPGWDMLLGLFVHAALGHPLSATNAALASGVTRPTAQRWLRLIEDAGLARHEPDPHGHGHDLVSLTPAGFAAMRAYLTEWMAN